MNLGDFPNSSITSYVIEIELSALRVGQNPEIVLSIFKLITPFPDSIISAEDTKFKEEK